MGLTIRCDTIETFPQNLETDICTINAVKWPVTVFFCFVLLSVGVYLLRKWKYRCHKTLLTFHNLRAAVALLLLAINSLELARAFLPLPATITTTTGVAATTPAALPTTLVSPLSTANNAQHNYNEGIGVGNDAARLYSGSESNFENPSTTSTTTQQKRQQQQQQQKLLLEQRHQHEVESDHVVVIIGVATLWNALAAILFTIMLMWYHRIVEIKKPVEFLYVSATVQIAVFFLRIYELSEIYYYLNVFELEPTLHGTTALCLLTMGIIDGFTIYKERYRPDYLEDYEKIGYKHTLATFYSKACFWWLTPLLWFGYQEPLELEDLGQMRLEDTARAHYDRFLLIYKTAKVKNADRPPSLWLCYLKSSWRMFALGGILKLFGDLFALIGPLAIQQIVQYIEIMYGLDTSGNTTSTNATTALPQINNTRSSNNNTSNNNSSIILRGLRNLYDNISSSSSQQYRRSLQHATASNWISNASNNQTSLLSLSFTTTTTTTSSSYDNNVNVNNIIDYNIGNIGTEVQIYYPTWLDLVSNGWAIAWIVLMAALAQGALSQASTHILNMTGIRIKTSLQGLIYRKTLLLNSTCIDSAGGGNGNVGAGDDIAEAANSINVLAVDKQQQQQQQHLLATNENNCQMKSSTDVDVGNNVAADATKTEQQKQYEENVNGSGLSDVGAITNLMSEDTLNIMSFFWIAHYVWAIPLKIAVVMYLLYLKLGFSAVIGSFVCILTMTPLQFLIGKAMSNNTETMAQYTDERLKRIHDTFVGIKLIKLNAWDDVFLKRICLARNKELKYLNKDSIYWTLMTILTHISSVLITFVTLAVYIQLESAEDVVGTKAATTTTTTKTNQFTASRLFSALALFQQLTVPLLIFPITVPYIISACVSTKRLERFLHAREIQKQFEGIRHMARILSKSDASLDMYEVKHNIVAGAETAAAAAAATTLITSNGGSSNQPTAKQKQEFQFQLQPVEKQNRQNERLALKIKVPDSPAPLAQSEPLTPLIAVGGGVGGDGAATRSSLETSTAAAAISHNFGFANSHEARPTTPTNNFAASANPESSSVFNFSEPVTLSSSASTSMREKKLSVQRKDLLRNTAYVSCRSRKLQSSSIVPSASAHHHHAPITRARLDSWHRDSLILKMPENMVVSVKQGTFSWNPQRRLVNALIIPDISIPQGRLSVIVGKNGSGKSSLLSALLMEMPLMSGDIIWNKKATTAYVPQQPWLLNASIRENILFGESFRPKRYDFVLEACALKPDIELMPDADFTVIGERGINLSGGQQKRVAIARALYSSANVVIMDDPLSSLDNEVARHIFEKSITKMLLKANRTVILVTQQLHLVQHADYLIVMKDCRLQASGSYKDIELKHPQIIVKWNSIIAKAIEREQQNLALVRSARERWKLFKNVSKLSLQRSISVLSSTGTVASVGVGAGDGDGGDGNDVVDSDAEIAVMTAENDDVLPASLPFTSSHAFGGSHSSIGGGSSIISNNSNNSNNNSFIFTRKRSSVYGSSRHLIYDVPLPIDECQSEDVIMRRRRRRGTSQLQRPNSRASNRFSGISNTSSTTTEYRRSFFTASGSSASNNSSNASTADGFSYEVASIGTGTSISNTLRQQPRVHSWQSQTAASANKLQHPTVARNISSPGSLLTTNTQQELEFATTAALLSDAALVGDLVKSSSTATTTTTTTTAAEKTAATTTTKPDGGFQQFLRRMSMRRSNKPSAVAASAHRSIHRPNSILSITEETTTLLTSGPATPAATAAAAAAKALCTPSIASILPSIQFSSAEVDGGGGETDSWIAHIEDEESVQDANIDYKTLTTNNNANAIGTAAAATAAVTATTAVGMHADTTATQTTTATQLDAERKYGKIPAQIYMLYLRASGLSIVLIFFITALIWQCLRIYTDVWLQQWTDHNSDAVGSAGATATTTTTAIIIDTNASSASWQNASAYSHADLQHQHEVTYYFRVYAVISCVCIIMAMISTPAGQLAGCNARRNLHDKLLQTIMQKSLHFFQVTPLGRIMNRFSNDMAVIDKKIAATSQRLLQFTLLCLCAILINVTITPWFILLTLPICVAYYVIQKFYRCSSRELQRIENSTNSPVISHLSETIQGVTTIRAYNQEARFTEILFRRLEANTIAFTILNTSNRWLGISLDYLGGFIVFIAIMTALITATISCSSSSSSNNNREHSEATTQAQQQLTPSPSLVGLAINYTLLVPIYLNWVVKLLADMEMYIGSVERIAYYAEDEDEDADADTEEDEAETLKQITIPAADEISQCFTAVDNDNASVADKVSKVLKADGVAIISPQQQQQLLKQQYASDADADENADKKLWSSTNIIEQMMIQRNDAERRASILSLSKGKRYKMVPISWPQRGDISFENVSLRYEGQKENVINNFTLKIPAGQRIGICGRTGSGKSSLALSLFGVLQTTSGRILIDDVDITQIHPDEIRTRLSIIPQDVHLFNATIRENLDPPGYYSDLALWNCLELAQLKEFVNVELPHGLDTEIVDGGLNFSTGHRQLFCLARAILRGSVCLVLDEATSSLDSTTEKALLAAAHKAFQGRTILTIAHRLSTILDYDRIIVMENGKIVEDGSPYELQQKSDGIFQALLHSGRPISTMVLNDNNNCVQQQDAVVL